MNRSKDNKCCPRSLALYRDKPKLDKVKPMTIRRNPKPEANESLVLRPSCKLACAFGHKTKMFDGLQNDRQLHLAVILVRS